MNRSSFGMTSEWKKLLVRSGVRGAILVTGLLLCAVLGSTIPGMHRRIGALLNGAEYLGTDGVIVQTQSNDCGAAALAMVLNGHGKRIRREEILPHLVMTAEGTTMDELRRFALSCGVELEGWRLTIDDLSRRRFPMVLFIKKDHFVTADSISQGAVFLRDPAIGRVKIPASRFQKMWDGYALVMKD